MNETLEVGKQYQWKDPEVQKLDNRQFTVTFNMGNGWYDTDRGFWVKPKHVVPVEPVEQPAEKQETVPVIREAFVVDKTLFYNREDAVNHVIKIKMHEKLKPVFDGVLSAQQEAILETLVEKLVMDRQLFLEVLGGWQ